jgi:tocopherol O-methyltransferase
MSITLTSDRKALLGGIALGAAISGLYFLLNPRSTLRRLTSAPAKTATKQFTPEEEAEMDVLKGRIREHYDGCSESYVELWGRHVHHGLWRPGSEGITKERAQEVLIEELYEHAQLPAVAKVLDVGCGVGGTSCWLATRGHNVTGISLSPKQIEMAKAAMKKDGVNVRFQVMDGEKIHFPGEEGTFDAVWISEALSHFPHKNYFFDHAMRMLKPGGKIVIVDWFTADSIGPKLTNGVIADIERGMLLPPMETVTGYSNLLVAAGARPVYMDDISKYSSKTWDISLDLISNSATWALATKMGKDFVDFLHAFKAMQEGFATGAFRFTILIAEKPLAAQVQ